MNIMRNILVHVTDWAWDATKSERIRATAATLVIMVCLGWLASEVARLSVSSSRWSSVGRGVSPSA